MLSGSEPHSLSLDREVSCITLAQEVTVCLADQLRQANVITDHQYAWIWADYVNWRLHNELISNLNCSVED